jgi:hypothetical protein
MNIKSASGFPTPKTVCVREQARCAHFVQAHTRSRIGSSNAALFDDGCSRRSVSDVCASHSEAATGCSVCNCPSTVLDARGARSVDSRILSSAAITKSRAGSVICSNRAKFCARMQFFLPRLLLTPDFRPVKFAVMDTGRFNGLRCYGKPLKRLACVNYMRQRPELRRESR